MAKFRDGMFGPAVILCAICLVIAVALAWTHRITLPIIELRALEAANETRQAVLPAAQAFTLITGKTLPEGVVEAYAADNGAGFVFQSQARGFKGPVTFFVGVDVEGNFTGINMFDHDETPGLGSRIGDAGYLSRFYGGTEVDGVDSVTGATVTSNALKTALRQVQEAYEAIKEGA